VIPHRHLIPGRGLAAAYADGAGHRADRANNARVPGRLEEALARAGKSLADMHVILEVGSNEAIKEAVLRGVGLAVLSTRAVEKELHAGRLHALPVTGLSLVRDMLAVWDRRRALPIPARLFLELLEASHGGSRQS
jgi:DNA-binding transcriptional LysR family regulator